MFKKLNDLTLNATRPPQADFLLLLNKWDDELTEHMTCSEEKCHSYKQDHIEWSPTVGVWLTRRWLLRRFLRFTQGKIKDPRNLIRDTSKKLELGDPSQVTEAQITAEIEVCGKKLTELQKLAPEMRRQRLKQRVKAARKVGGDEKAEVILKMLTKEAQKKRWQRVNYS